MKNPILKESLSHHAILGYDFFISFTLGDYPRGTQSYASDLARCLREKDYLVFYSEEEAPPGAELDQVVLKALNKTKVFIVIVNEGALLNSIWVRKEVEHFRKKHPKGMIIPINVGDTLEKLGEKIGAVAWLNYKKNIYLNEAEDMVKAGIVSENVVDRIVVTARVLKKKNIFRTVLTIFILLLIALTFFSCRSKNEAEDQRVSSVLRLISSLHQNGEFKLALEAAKSEPKIPLTTLNNAKLALYDTGRGLDFNLEKSDFDIMEIFIEKVNGIVQLIYQESDSDIGVIKIGAGKISYICQDGYTSEDERFDSGLNSSSVFTKLNYGQYLTVDESGLFVDVRNYDNCSKRTIGFSEFIKAHEDGFYDYAEAVVEILSNNKFIFKGMSGDIYIIENNIVRIFYFAKPQENIIFIKHNSKLNQLLLISQQGSIFILDDQGNIITDKINLEKGKTSSIKDQVFLNFVRNEWGKDGFVKLINFPGMVGSDIQIIFSTLIKDNNLYFFIKDYSGSNEYFRAIRSKINFKGKNSCPWIDAIYDSGLGSKLPLLELVHFPVLPLCQTYESSGREERVYKTALPNKNSDSLAPTTFCENDNTIIMGTETGQVIWFQYEVNYFDGLVINIQHAEQSKKDIISDLICDQDNIVYVGFRSMGIQLFKPNFRVKETLDHEKMVSLDRKNGTESFNTTTHYGDSQLILNYETGELSLVKDNQLIWSKHVASTIPRRYDEYIIRIENLLLDEKMGMVWLLISNGLVILFDLNTGSQLSMFITSYNNSYLDSSIISGTKLYFDGNGGVYFRYKIDREDGGIRQKKIYISLVNKNI